MQDAPAKLTWKCWLETHTSETIALDFTNTLPKNPILDPHVKLTHLQLLGYLYLQFEGPVEAWPTFPNNETNACCSWGQVVIVAVGKLNRQE